MSERELAEVGIQICAQLHDDDQLTPEEMLIVLGAAYRATLVDLPQPARRVFAGAHVLGVAQDAGVVEEPSPDRALH